MLYASLTLSVTYLLMTVARQLMHTNISMCVIVIVIIIIIIIILHAHCVFMFV